MGKQTAPENRSAETSAGAVSSRSFNVIDFPIVGIGASAGGLEALEDFFSNLDPESGIAFVVVTHQHPTYKSMLTELLAKKCTGMDVSQVTRSTLVRRNCVYLNPPGKNLKIVNGALHAVESAEENFLRLPIDFFFRSLAEYRKDHAIGIILSGTGTDGTLGIRKIKGESGMVMVQEESTARFSGMPESAINTGLADYILPPAKMPGQLLKYVKGPFLLPEDRIKSSAPSLDEMMDKICMKLRFSTGHDFSHYKVNTTRRRIERRMNVHHITRAEDYLKYLEENPQECNILFQELLIGVTAFFRDPEAFACLQKIISSSLFKNKPEGYNFRIWVPGCASGEEIYSLAILFKECMEKIKKRFSFQFFGTDLDSKAIGSARAGLYPEGIAVDVGARRLQKYFCRENYSYRIRKDIREMAIFATQNLIKDPPFTKLDLISCRNLLIYLDSETQYKILSMFNYGLNPDGLLFLGNYETPGAAADLFKNINKKWKIYSSISQPKLSLSDQSLMDAPIPYAVPDKPRYFAPMPIKEKPVNFQLLANGFLMERFLPPSLIVDQDGMILHIHGRTGRFLEPAPGKPSQNIFAMAREGLKAHLSVCLHKAQRQTNPVIEENVGVKSNGGHTAVRIVVQKISKPETLRNLFLVVFETLKNKEPRTPKKSRGSGAGKVGRYLTQIESLERELQFTKETLQSTIEELETTNEELKSTNEELQSTNEELQSSNEEIETSKEELQSLNEELQTTNTELQTKVEELSKYSDDMKNLLNSTDIATLFLDNQLRISRFTEKTTRIINLISADIGRPIKDISTNLKYADFEKDCRSVLEQLVPREADLQTNDQLWYQMKIIPYRTSENRIEGLVVTFFDITRLKSAR